MANIFNGTTITLNGKSFTKIQSIKKTTTVKEVEVTGEADSYATFETGIPAHQVDVEVLGAQAVADTEAGALVITWNDETSDSWASAKVFNVSQNGTINGAISRTFTIRKTA